MTQLDDWMTIRMALAEAAACRRADAERGDEGRAQARQDRSMARDFDRVAKRVFGSV